MKLAAIRKQKLITNSDSAKVFYGVHIYPGVAEYNPENSEPYRLLLRGKTLKEMDPTYQGRPVFVLHNLDYSEVVNSLRGECDGWVIRSFYNEADGQHWAEFVIHSTRGLEAIRKGYGLSNSYHRTNTDENGGVHNGLHYDKEVLAGEYDHLALVPDPRYTTKIMNPKEFQRYNDEKRSELLRVSNSKDKGSPMKKLSIFTRQPVTNSKDLAEKLVHLEKSGQEKSILEIAKIADEHLASAGKPRVCNAADVVEVEDDEGKKGKLTVEELLAYIQKLEVRIEELEAAGGDSEEDFIENEDDEDGDDMEENEDDSDEEDEDDDIEENEDDTEMNAEDASERVFRVSNSLMGKKGKKPAPKPAKKKAVQNSMGKKKAKKKADAIRNANDNFHPTANHLRSIDTPANQVARGKQRYGSAE